MYYNEINKEKENKQLFNWANTATLEIAESSI